MYCYFLIVLMLLRPWPSPSMTEGCIKLDISEAVETADLIAYGTIMSVSEYPNGSLYYLKITEQFKQSEFSLKASVFQSNSLKHNISFVIGKQYLVYGYGTRENRYWIKTSCQMRTVPLAKAAYDLRYLRAHIPCENNPPPDKKGCPRNIHPVCGCNGITYFNRCYAFNAGVTWWVPGGCD